MLTEGHGTLFGSTRAVFPSSSSSPSCLRFRCNLATRLSALLVNSFITMAGVSPGRGNDHQWTFLELRSNSPVPLVDTVNHGFSSSPPVVAFAVGASDDVVRTVCFGSCSGVLALGSDLSAAFFPFGCFSTPAGSEIVPVFVTVLALLDDGSLGSGLVWMVSSNVTSAFLPPFPGPNDRRPISAVFHWLKLLK